MVYYFRQMKEFQNEELKKAKHYISGQREFKISRLRFLKNKRQSAIAYLLLRYGLRKEYGINENVVLSEGSCGKPYLSNYPFVHFNLSHCDKGVACMISDSAVGIDITSVKKENMSCMYSSMTADEIEKILHAENPAVQFTKFWSLKESYCYINTVYSNSLASEIKKTERYIKRQENVASKMQQQILNIRCSQELLSKLNFSLKCKKEYHPLLLEELLDLRTESEIENIFDNFSQEYIQYSVEMRKKILAQTILFYMNKKGVLLKDIPCTLNQILKCLSVNTDNNDIIYRWIELLKKYNYVTETDGIYVCKIEIYEKGLKYGWEEVEYLWKGKLESPLVLDYIINNIKNWDKLIQKEQQATLLLFEQGEDIYADALYKETKILQYLNHSLSKKVLGYLYENANATILEIGAGTGATSDKVLSDIRENKFEEHIVYFYTDISRFFLQRAKERYKECDGKIEMHYQTLDIDEAFSSQLPSNFQADIVIAVGVLNNSVNTDKCIYEINSVMKPGGILLIIETVEDVPDILITQSFMMTEPKDQRKATNTMFLNRKQWLEILEENGFCNSEEFPGYGEYLEVLGQKLFYCTKE